MKISGRAISTRQSGRRDTARSHINGNDFMLRSSLSAAVIVFAFATPALAADADVEVPAAGGGAELTIYPNDLALVRERRTFRLPAASARLALGGVSSRLQPETAVLQVLKGTGLKITEQSF